MKCVWKAAAGADDVWGGVGDVRGGTSNVQGSADPLLVRSLTSPTCYTLVCFLCAATSGRYRPGKSVKQINNSV